MTLRRRLLALIVGAGLVLVAGFAVGRELLLRHLTETALRSMLEARIDALGRERCEAGDLPLPHFPRGPGPRGPWFGGGGRAAPGEPRPMQLFFYDRDLTPRVEPAPPLPAAVRERLSRGETFAMAPAPAGRPGLMGVLATGWGSERCAYAAAFLPIAASPGPSWAFALLGLGLLAALAGVVSWATASPVRRIRALGEAMRASAARRYEGSVEARGEDEIADLARAFNDASAAVRRHVVDVERRERALRDFVAHTMHDLGLPLSVLAGQLDEMRSRLAAGGVVAPPQVAAAIQETHYIASLLQNLAAVARLETEEALRETHPVDLSALVERVVLRHRGLARDAGVEINHSVPEGTVTVPGDVTLLEQAVNNLVHNAVQYNRRGGHVAVVLDSDEARFSLRVTDDGLGVPPGELPRLGQARFRSDEARSRRPGGMGLGLAITRDVARRHGFELEFRRSGGGGLEAELSGKRS